MNRRRLFALLAGGGAALGGPLAVPTWWQRLARWLAPEPAPEPEPRTIMLVTEDGEAYIDGDAEWLLSGWYQGADIEPFGVRHHGPITFDVLWDDDNHGGHS